MSISSTPESRSQSLERVVLDTNVFVAAGFNRGSHAARILDAVRNRQLHMVWNDATRRETLGVLRRIPPLSEYNVDEFFRQEEQFAMTTFPEQFTIIPDPDDRKFAALAHAAGAILVSRDEHLLRHRNQLDVTILTPQEYWSRPPTP